MRYSAPNFPGEFEIPDNWLTGTGIDSFAPSAEGLWRRVRWLSSCPVDSDLSVLATVDRLFHQIFWLAIAKQRKIPADFLC
jgi:hypothetical protein